MIGPRVGHSVSRHFPTAFWSAAPSVKCIRDANNLNDETDNFNSYFTENTPYIFREFSWAIDSICKLFVSRLFSTMKMKRCFRNVGELPLCYATVNGSFVYFCFGFVALIFLWYFSGSCCYIPQDCTIHNHRLENFKFNDVTPFRHLIFIYNVNQLKSTNTMFGGNFEYLNVKKVTTAC